MKYKVVFTYSTKAEAEDENTALEIASEELEQKIHDYVESGESPVDIFIADISTKA